MPNFRKVFGEHYLLRAASEMLLIVVGVLLALAIDAWLEDRQERKSEVRYLEGLLADVRTDVNEYTILVSELELYQRAVEIMKSVTDGHSNNFSSPNHILRVLRCSTFLPAPVESRGTFTDLLSTGNLALLHDGETRRAVLSYFSRIDASAQFKDELRAYQMNYRRIILEFSTLDSAEEDEVDVNALVARMQSDKRLGPALNRMQFGQRRMRIRARANRKDAEALEEFLEGALFRAGGDPQSVHQASAPSAQFSSGCSEILSSQ